MQVNLNCDVVVDPRTKLVIREFCGLDIFEGEHRHYWNHCFEAFSNHLCTSFEIEHSPSNFDYWSSAQCSCLCNISSFIISCMIQELSYGDVRVLLVQQIIGATHLTTSYQVRLS